MTQTCLLFIVPNYVYGPLPDLGTVERERERERERRESECRDFKSDKPYSGGSRIFLKRGRWGFVKCFDALPYSHMPYV